jgi:hypothetical protein
MQNLYGNNLWENTSPDVLRNAMGTRGIGVTDFDYLGREIQSFGKKGRKQ